MKKNIITLLVGVLLTGTVVFGQSIQNSVIASAGASASATNVTMDYTIGEIVVETFSAGGNSLTQGFHQTNLTLVAIENIDLFSNISIYPNPTSDMVNISMPEGSGKHDIIMYDAVGKLIASHYETNGLITLDVQTLASGTYYLQIIDSVDKKFKTFKLIKNQ